MHEICVSFSDSLKPNSFLSRPIQICNKVFILFGDFEEILLLLWIVDYFVACLFFVVFVSY